LLALTLRPTTTEPSAETSAPSLKKEPPGKSPNGVNDGAAATATLSSAVLNAANGRLQTCLFPMAAGETRVCIFIAEFLS
jgi:hypothetical protein